MSHAYIPDKSQIPAPPKLNYIIPAVPKHVLRKPDPAKKHSVLSQTVKVKSTSAKMTGFMQRNYAVLSSIRNALQGDQPHKQQTVKITQTLSKGPGFGNMSQKIPITSNVMQNDDSSGGSSDSFSDYDPNRF